MKTFKKCAAQGDIWFIRLDEAVDVSKMTEVKPENGELIVTHSETGHHHVMEPSYAKMYRGTNEQYDSILVIDRPTSLDHKRSFDTHESILFEAGTYMAKRQREYTPEGFRRVED